MKKNEKNELNNQFTVSKILMIVGALWIIVYGVLTATKIVDGNFYGWTASWTTLILIGLFYILLPFSTKRGWWSRIWAILLTIVSLVVVIGNFFGNEVDFQSYWTYIMPLPHFLMALGSILWIIQG